MFGSERAWNMGAIAVGATVYFDPAESDRQNNRSGKSI
jgi:DhnA family fructose-bisphosphate aldolase class Ia